MIQDCWEVAKEWSIRGELAIRLAHMERIFKNATGHDLQIISGFRTCAKQMDLGTQGRPAAPCELSTHVICPAMGADLRVAGAFPSRTVKQAFGNSAVLAGLRWGGGSERDENGIPSDWNHVDLGPRTDEVAQEFRRKGSPTQ